MTLEDGKDDARGWLTLKMRTGRFSQLLVEQLAWHDVNRTVDAHAVLDEIGYLEDPSRARIGTKLAEQFKRSPLKGFWHQHWFEARFLARNLGNYVRSAEAKPICEAMADAVNRGDDPGRYVHELVIGGHERRAGRRTGEWIVFAKVEGANYYLTLANHDEGRHDPAAILKRIKVCAIEFPEIKPLISPPLVA